MFYGEVFCGLGRFAPSLGSQTSEFFGDSADGSGKTIGAAVITFSANAEFTQLRPESGVSRCHSRHPQIHCFNHHSRNAQAVSRPVGQDHHISCRLLSLVATFFEIALNDFDFWMGFKPNVDALKADTLKVGGWPIGFIPSYFSCFAIRYLAPAINHPLPPRHKISR